MRAVTPSYAAAPPMGACFSGSCGHAPLFSRQTPFCSRPHADAACPLPPPRLADTLRCSVQSLPRKMIRVKTALQGTMSACRRRTKRMAHLTPRHISLPIESRAPPFANVSRAHAALALAPPSFSAPIQAPRLSEAMPPIVSAIAFFAAPPISPFPRRKRLRPAPPCFHFPKAHAARRPCFYAPAHSRNTTPPYAASTPATVFDAPMKTQTATIKSAQKTGRYFFMEFLREILTFCPFRTIIKEN